MTNYILAVNHWYLTSGDLEMRSRSTKINRAPLHPMINYYVWYEEPGLKNVGCKAVSGVWTALFGISWPWKKVKVNQNNRVPLHPIVNYYLWYENPALKTWAVQWCQGSKIHYLTSSDLENRSRSTKINRAPLRPLINYYVWYENPAVKNAGCRAVTGFQNALFDPWWPWK